MSAGASAAAVLAMVLSTIQQAADSTFWDRGDGRLAIAATAAVGTLAIFDERIARWIREPSVQGDSGRRDLIESLTTVNEVPLTLAAVATYGIGRLAKSHTITDVGLHLTTSLVATEVVSEVARVAISRMRPRASEDDAFEFSPGEGLAAFEYRSFPSMHAAVAFATASVLTEELRVRKARSRRVVIPLLYAAATIPGFTRLYLDQHWASDVLAGSIVGAFIGSRVVRYSHARRTRVDRWLLRPWIAHDGVMPIVGITLTR